MGTRTAVDTWFVRICAGASLGIAVVWGIQGLGQRLGLETGAALAPELSGPFVMALALASLALLLQRAVPRLPGVAGVCVLGLATLLLARGLLDWDEAGLLHAALPSGAPLLSRLLFAVWLAGAGALLCILAWPGPRRAVAALLVLAGQGFAVAGAWAFALLCWRIFGALPDGTVLLGPAALLMLSLLNLGLGRAVWRLHKERNAAPELAHRRAFARSTALLFGFSLLAGIAVGAVVSAHIADLMAEILSLRAQRQAVAIERYVQRTAELAQLFAGRGERPPGSDEPSPAFDAKGLSEAFQRLGDRVLAVDPAHPQWGAATPPQAAMPVLATGGVLASLLPNRGVQIEFRDRAGGPPQALIQVLPAPGQAYSVEGALPRLAVSQLNCQHRPGARPRCVDMSKPQPAEDWLALGGVEDWLGQEPALLRGIGQSGAPALTAVAPMGPLGAFVAIQGDAFTLLLLLGGPMLVSVLSLAGLALLGAVWSYRRQLPQMRRIYLDRAQAMATTHHMPLAVLIVDGAGGVALANPAAAALLGRTPEQVQGLPVETLIPDLASVPAAGPDPTRSDAGIRLAALAANGESIPVELRSAQFRHMGQHRRVIMLRDLRSELRAAGDIQRWQQVFQESGWGMVIGSVGEQPVFELVNPAFARMVGYTPEELAGQPLRLCIAASHHATLAALRERAEAEGHVRAEMRHLHRDGREFPTLVDLSAVRDAQGRLQHFVVSVQDISELKRSEEQVGRIAAHLRAVLDALPVGVWIGDAQGRLTQTNRAAELLWCGAGQGLGPEVETEPAADGSAQPWWLRDPSATAGHDSLLRRAAVTGQRIDAGVREIGVGADGAARSILSSASPMLDKTGQLIGAIAVDEDVTLLRQGEQAAKQAQALLERILEACAVGIAVCDLKGTVLRRNLAWKVLLGGRRRDKARPESVPGDLLEAGDPLRQREMFQRVGLGQVPHYFGEHHMRRTSGEFAWTLMVVSRLPVAAGEAAQVLVQVLDVDARRKSLEAIAANQYRLAAAQRLAGIGDWHWRVDTDALECSGQMLAMLGIGMQDREHMTRERMLGLIHAEDRERVRSAFDAALASAGRLDVDCRMARADGGAGLSMQIQGLAQRTPAGPAMAGTLQDVTERKRIEADLRQSRERLRELVAYEGQMIEDERKRISREVHDELGQLLTALRMDLSMLRGQLAPDAALRSRADKMRETMNTMADVVRHVASNLRPAALDLGLTAAIEWLAEDFSHRWELSCEVELPQDHEPVLPEAVALALFRAVQESLTNVARHASARHVRITLQSDAERLQLTIADDGHGFDTQAIAARRGGGLGLLGMRERMHMIGAQITISSGATGTVVDIRYDPAEKPSL